jgi:copper transport protein
VRLTGTPLVRLCAGLLVAAQLLSAPAGALAHAELLIASPGPGIGLAQAPAAVVIKFSEPLNFALSRIEVLDPTGIDVGSRPTEAVVGDSQAMRRPLGVLPIGQYVVRWTSVSALDGHSLRGSYAFAVGTAANPGTTVSNGPLDSEGPLGLVGRFVELIALGAWLAWGLLGRASRRAGLNSARTALVGRLAPMLVFGGAFLSLLSTTLVATGSFGAVGAVLASPSGEARLVVLAAASIGVLIGARSTPLAVALATVAIVAEAASGHAASSALPSIAIVSFAIHLSAVGVWIYAIGASVFLAPEVRRALGTFTPYAVGAAVITAGTGLVSAIIELTAPSDLVATGYGLTLLAKSVAFALMASFGLIHFVLRRRPTIEEPTLRRPVRAEAVVATVAVVLATLLVGFPNPPREAEATTAELTTTDPLLSELGRRDALSIADASGPFVVGLTILPPRPGPAEIRIQIVGVDPGDGFRNARFSATTIGASIGVLLGQACGVGCFAGTATFSKQGDWRLKVDVDSNRGPISISVAVPLPTPDGSAALTRTVAAEEGLKSGQMTETVRARAGNPPYVSTYRFQAPDRAEIALRDSTEILIGEQGFRRSGNGAWEKFSFPAPGFSWPTGYYRDFWAGAAAARIMGSATIDGVPSLIITFVRPDVPAWFRIWVSQADGIVQREEMRAEGHLMDHTFADLNGPISVQAPP